MPSIQDTAYPRLKSNPTDKELIRLYTPTTEELELARRVTSKPVTCLCFLVLLKTFQRLSYGVILATVPAGIIRRIVKSTQLPTSQQDLSQYDDSDTRRRHLTIIREYLQIFPFDQTASQAMIQALEMAVLAKHGVLPSGSQIPSASTVGVHIGAQSLHAGALQPIISLCTLRQCRCRHSRNTQYRVPDQGFQD